MAIYSIKCLRKNRDCYLNCTIYFSIKSIANDFVCATKPSNAYIIGRRCGVGCRVQTPGILLYTTNEFTYFVPSVVDSLRDRNYIAEMKTISISILWNRTRAWSRIRSHITKIIYVSRKDFRYVKKSIYVCDVYIRNHSYWISRLRKEYANIANCVSPL